MRRKTPENGCKSGVLRGTIDPLEDTAGVVQTWDGDKRSDNPATEMVEHDLDFGAIGGEDFGGRVAAVAPGEFEPVADACEAVFADDFAEKGVVFVVAGVASHAGLELDFGDGGLCSLS